MLVLVPSRGRPGNIAALAATWAAMGSTADLYVCVDEDDPTLMDYVAVYKQDQTAFTLLVGPRMRLGGTLNHYSQRFLGSFSVIGFMGDDHRPRTPRWDKIILETVHHQEVAEGYAVAYGDDLLQRKNLPTAVFMSSVLIGRLGFMVPPGQTHLYLDDFWKLLGQRLGALVYCPRVIIEHMHPVAGKAVSDALYAEVNSPEMYNADMMAFKNYVATEFDNDIARLQKLAGMK